MFGLTKHTIPHALHNHKEPFALKMTLTISVCKPVSSTQVFLLLFLL